MGQDAAMQARFGLEGDARVTEDGTLHVCSRAHIHQPSNLCYGGVTVVLDWCYHSVTAVIRWCYSGELTLCTQRNGVIVAVKWCCSGLTCQKMFLAWAPP